MNTQEQAAYQRGRQDAEAEAKPSIEKAMVAEYCRGKTTAETELATLRTQLAGAHSKIRELMDERDEAGRGGMSWKDATS